MISGLASFFMPSYPVVLVYMLQSTEYQPGPYLAWYGRVKNFSTVRQRRQLDRTKAALALLAMLYVGIGLQLLLAVGLFVAWLNGLPYGLYLALAIFLVYPILWAHLIVVPLILGRWFIVRPRERKLIIASEVIFRHHPGTIIAVAGSYGKTTMKEMLNTVLSTGLKVAATPANKNVPISHAYFAKRLTGDEDVLIIEYGEGAPGDVKRFAEVTHPKRGIITGIAPAHLDHYKTLDAAAKDIFLLGGAVGNKHTYVNGESEPAKPYIKLGQHVYDRHGVLDWEIKDTEVGYDGTSFTMVKNKHKLHLKSGILGRHQVGPLALVAALAAELGLSDEQIEEGIAKTVPFEHRMQPRQLGGAWIIDDTYNGTIEGLKAGIELLKELPAKRRIYVTPGLVDQGEETITVHEELGRVLSTSGFDEIVLMQNSVTAAIIDGLSNGETPFGGELRLVDTPLDFYTSLEHFVAAGDTVLMQNDWTDNYA